jgi:hypothetical protein
MPSYYDGPREGIADFEGQPHLYESEWNEGLNLEADTFLLSPVAPDIFALAMESWEIWLRWEAAFYGGRTTLETHPALPEDRPRHEELQQFLKPHLVIDPANCIRARGWFRSAAGVPTNPYAGFGALEVRWERMTPSSSGKLEQ